MKFNPFKKDWWTRGRVALFVLFAVSSLAGNPYAIDAVGYSIGYMGMVLVSVWILVTVFAIVVEAAKAAKRKLTKSSE